MLRKIINIDREKCNGCGLCASACHEGAIEIVDGKAALIRDDYCDGFGDCLPHCPMDAISFTYKDTIPYDEQAVAMHKEKKKNSGSHKIESCLDNWPVQIKLAQVRAPFYAGCHLLIAADCTAFSYGSFHTDFIADHVVLIGCSKLDNIDYSQKLAAIIANNAILDITVVKMEVPCCSALEMMVRNAIEFSKKKLLLKIVTISIEGKILDE